MAEWSIAAVLKTVELQGSGGSNPSLSAERYGLCILSLQFSDQHYHSGWGYNDYEVRI